MLVLHRKKGEDIVIGKNIHIRITEVGNDGVKIAIEAPPDVQIMRGELAETIVFNQEAQTSKKINISEKVKEWQSLV